jgi:ankyrin repeat protein
VIKLLLERESDKSTVIGKYGAPLHLAAMFGSYQIQEILFKSGAPFFTTTTEDHNGRIPLHLGISYGDFGALTLVANESEHDLLIRRDRLERHSLHFAAGLDMSQSVKEIIELFPDAIHDKDIDGWTPLHWACREKSFIVF